VCRLPKHDRLRDDLVAPKYSFMSDGRIQIEPKQQMRARGLPSSDFADAFLLTLASQGLGVSSQHDSGLYSQTPVRPMVLGME
jgi:hypothetical protein